MHLRHKASPLQAINPMSDKLFGWPAIYEYYTPHLMNETANLPQGNVFL